MITEKALKIKKKLIKADSYSKQLAIADELYNELFDNCKPTPEEFRDVVAGVLVSAVAFWRICARVFDWQ